MGLIIRVPVAGALVIYFIYIINSRAASSHAPILTSASGIISLLSHPSSFLPFGFLCGPLLWIRAVMGFDLRIISDLQRGNHEFASSFLVSFRGAI